MNIEHWDIWNRLTFKTLAYRKNFDLVIKNENIITEHSGTISLLNIIEHKVPTLIGEYSFSVWNIKLGNLLKININKLIKDHHLEDTYDELIKLVKNEDFDMKYDKVVLIHSLVVHPKYRKCGVTEEFLESIYRDFDSNNTRIIMLCKPIQDNKINAEFYFNEKIVQYRTELGVDKIPAMKYYSLHDLNKLNDREINEYKLFNVAQKCGLRRMSDYTYLFLLIPDKIISRIKFKSKFQSQLKSELK